MVTLAFVETSIRVKPIRATVVLTALLLGASPSVRTQQPIQASQRVDRQAPQRSALPQRGEATEPDAFTTVLHFSVTDDRERFTVGLSRDLMLEVRRTVDVSGHPMGWDLTAADRRLKDSPNFFYDCLCGHGPRPHDLYAWHFVTNYYPSERILPVYGYPFDVRVRCVGCEVTGTDGKDAKFVHGTVEVSLRRLRKSNPPQRRIS